MQSITTLRRRLTACVLAGAVLLSSVVFAGGWVGAAGQTGEGLTQSFDPATGRLAVDYAAYLAKNDLVFNQPIKDPVQGVMVGNGRVGAQVWNTNGLTMQVSGVDAAENGFASQGQVNLYTTPAMDAGEGAFQQRLSLYDGALTARYAGGSTVTVMGVPGTEALGIHVEDPRAGVETVTLDLSIWDLQNLVARAVGSGDNLQAWKTVEPFADTDAAGFSRAQADSNQFGYTLAAAVQGTEFTAAVVDDSTVRLQIEPAESYTIWLSCASRLNAPEQDSRTQAMAELAAVKQTGYSAALESFKAWWHGFWESSFVQYSNADQTADYLESAYDLFMYAIAGGAFANYPFHFINGAYSGMDDNDSDHWSHGYWYWNQRDVYNSFFASNHADMMQTFLNLYTRNFETLQSETQKRFGFEGLYVPETMNWDGMASGLSQHTRTLYSTAAEIAQNLYNMYEYTGDMAYLRDTAYPFMREAARFYVNMLSYNSETGQYYMAESNAHETYPDVQNALTDLAAVRTLFPNTIEAGALLQNDADAALFAQLQEILDHLAPYPMSEDGTVYLPCDTPVPEAINMENVVNELAWPYSVTGIGYPDQQIAIESWRARPFPYANVWAPDAIQAARLGMGDEAYAGMIRMLDQYQNYPNGRTTNDNGEFEYMGVHLSAMNESLLQSYDGVIRVFPAMPADDTLTSRFTLLAKGGFLVSSEYASGAAKYVGLKSRNGGSATFQNPWGTEEIRVRDMANDTVILTTAAAQFRFDTAAGGVYIIERSARPFADYTHVKVTGSPNQGMKALAGTDSTLGTPVPGRIEAEAAQLTGTLTAGQDAEASNWAVVSGFAKAGDAITFKNTDEGNRLRIGYKAAGSAGQIGVYVNDVRVRSAVLPSADAAGGSFGVAEFKINIPAGSTVKLQRDAGDTEAVIDYIQVDGGAWPVAYDATRYEAEAGALAGSAVTAADTAASGGMQVTGLTEQGGSVTLSGVAAGSHLRIAYCTKNSAARMSLYINGANTGKDISFPSTGRASGGYEVLTYAYRIPEGASVMLKLDSGDIGVNLDYIETATPRDVVRYEAEEAELYNANIVDDGAASNGKQVKDMSSSKQSSVTFKNVAAATQLAVRYCTANEMGSMRLYVNDTDTGIDVRFPNTGRWNRDYATVYLDYGFAAGDTIRLQMENGAAGANLDYIELNNRLRPDAEAVADSVGQRAAEIRLTLPGDAEVGERGVVYSADLNNGSAAISAPLAQGDTVALTQLAPGVTYAYQAYAVDAFGYVWYGPLHTFQTVGVPVERIALSETQLTLEKGEQQRLQAEILPAEAANAPLIWTSADKTIAAVSEDGLVTAVSGGVVEITVASANGVTDVCTVTVLDPVKEAANAFVTKIQTRLNGAYSTRDLTAIRQFLAEYETLDTQVKAELAASAEATGLLSGLQKAETALENGAHYFDGFEGSLNWKLSASVTDTAYDDNLTPTTIYSEEAATNEGDAEGNAFWGPHTVTGRTGNALYLRKSFNAANLEAVKDNNQTKPSVLAVTKDILPQGAKVRRVSGEMYLSNNGYGDAGYKRHLGVTFNYAGEYAWRTIGLDGNGHIDSVVRRSANGGGRENWFQLAQGSYEYLEGSAQSHRGGTQNITFQKDQWMSFSLAYDDARGTYVYTVSGLDTAGVEQTVSAAILKDVNGMLPQIGLVCTDVLGPAFDNIAITLDSAPDLSPETLGAKIPYDTSPVSEQKLRIDFDFTGAKSAADAAGVRFTEYGAILLAGTRTRAELLAAEPAVRFAVEDNAAVADLLKVEITNSAENSGKRVSAIAYWKDSAGNLYYAGNTSDLVTDGVAVKSVMGVMKAYYTAELLPNAQTELTAALAAYNAAAAADHTMDDLQAAVTAQVTSPEQKTLLRNVFYHYFLITKANRS